MESFAVELLNEREVHTHLREVSAGRNEIFRFHALRFFGCMARAAPDAH